MMILIATLSAFIYYYYYYYYYYYFHVMPFFQVNLGQLVPPWVLL